MRSLLIICFLLCFILKGYGQLRIVSGTTLFIESGTKFSIDIPGNNFVIDSGAFVINQGEVLIGDSTNILEPKNYPIVGIGTEITTRNLNATLVGINIAGLGMTFNNDSITGITTITRGHKAIYVAGPNESVKRWYKLQTTGIFPVGFSVTINYDTSEINGNNSSTLRIITSNDTTSWYSLGGIPNATLFNSTANIDSSVYFGLFSSEINFSNLSDTSLCAGDLLMVDFFGSGMFNASNLFILQVSDASGSFVSPILQDTLSSDLLDFAEVFSPFISPGSGYKIRIISTNPTLNSADTGITIYGLPVISMSGLLDQYCANESPSFTNLTPTGGIYDVSYLAGDSIYPSIATIGLNYFNYSFTDINGCTAIYTDSIEILIAPSIPVITLSYDTLFSSSSGANQWYFNGAILTGEINSFLIAASNGLYQVETTNSSGCSTLSDTFNFTTLDLASHNGFNNSFSVYPNPVAGNKINIFLSGSFKGRSITLFSMIGQIVYSSEIDPEKEMQEIIIPELAPGTYSIALTTSKNRVISKPLIVIK